MYVKKLSKQVHTDYYALKLLVALLLLLLLLAYSSFYIIQNYFSNSFLENFSDGKKVYILQSTNVKSMYEQNNMDYEGYLERVKYFENLAMYNNISNVQKVYSYELVNLDKNAILIALDMMSLSKSEINDIDKFVIHGGKILFNFTSGFLDKSLSYQSDNLVHRITNLSLDTKIETIKYDRNSTGYLSTRLLSPVTTELPKGKALELVIYDPLPIFHTPKSMAVDAYLTKWSQTNYLSMGPNKELQEDQSALIWHGTKGKGKWVYFSFPTYSFIEANKGMYADLFSGMLSYLQRDVNIVPYPYIDSKNIIFVSEDTEYKFENFKQFFDAGERNHFPITAFCVANLAQEHKELMQTVTQGRYMEVGSHSYTHKKIVGEALEVYEHETIDAKKLLHSLTGQEIRGFRPPREEIDETMIGLLEGAGFKYILGAGDNVMTPYFIGNIMLIPRHGTDDYSYLVNLDWDKASVLKEMKHQTNVIVNLDGIFTLSTHTHLMTFGSNIEIVDKYFQYVNSQPQMTPMNGSMLYTRVAQRLKLNVEFTENAKKIVMVVNNANDEVIHNMHYTLYVDKNIILKDVESEIIGVKTRLTRISDTEYQLIIKQLKPRSEMVLFINYDKNS